MQRFPLDQFSLRGFAATDENRVDVCDGGLGSNLGSGLGSATDSCTMRLRRRLQEAAQPLQETVYPPPPPPQNCNTGVAVVTSTATGKQVNDFRMESVAPDAPDVQCGSTAPLCVTETSIAGQTCTLTSVCAEGTRAFLANFNQRQCDECAFSGGVEAIAANPTLRCYCGYEASQQAVDSACEAYGNPPPPPPPPLLDNLEADVSAAVCALAPGDALCTVDFECEEERRLEEAAIPPEKSKFSTPTISVNLAGLPPDRLEASARGVTARGAPTLLMTADITTPTLTAAQVR